MAKGQTGVVFRAVAFPTSTVRHPDGIHQGI
jgi:hypothetical protein